MRADGNVDGIVLVGDAAHGGFIDIGVVLDIDVAHREDGVDVLVQALAREAVSGNAVAHHAAHGTMHLEHRNLVPHQCAEVGARKAGRAAADNGDALAGVGKALGGGNLVGRGIVYRIFLDGADVKRRVDKDAAAALLARVLAHQRAGRGERVVLADHLNRTGIVAFAHHGDVGGNVHMGRAHGFARHALAHASAAGVIGNVRFNLGSEGVHGVERGLGGLVADGAVGRVADHLRQRAHGFHGFGGCAALRKGAHHFSEFGQAIAAGNAFAAGLQRARLQKRCLERQRALPGRCGFHPALEAREVGFDLCVGGRSGLN